MARFFLDSSALVKRYRKEVGSAWVLTLASSFNHLIISRLTNIEVASALLRRSAESTEAASAMNMLNDDLQEIFDVIELNDAIMTGALRMVHSHRLRAADAIQLSAALVSQPAGSREEFIFVSADLELNAAAKAEGLMVENPMDHG